MSPLTLPFYGVEAMACASDLAVVIVDMQKSYLGYTTAQKRERIIPAHQQLIEVCGARNIPIAVLEMDCSGKTVSEIGEKLQYVRRVCCITKSSADGFWRTLLEHTLWGWESRTLLVTGCMASACVKTTIQSALSRKYRVRTAEILVADEDCHGIEPPTEQLYRESGCLREPSIEELFSPR